MNQRRLLILILLLLSFILTAFTVFAVANGDLPAVSGRAFSLYLAENKEFVIEKNASQRLPMASTTKIMTALLALEHCNLNETVEIPKEATNIEGSSIYLKEDDVITVRDLVYSVLLQSANDAATALAIKISGDIETFSELMNLRAAEIGLSDTSFENPHGLDSENHYTTAHDLAILASVALQNEAFKKICSTYKYSFTISGSPRHIVNHNKLLRRYDGAVGVKTGYTQRSGRCLVSAAERDGITFVAVTLDAPDDWNDHKRLLDYGFSSYKSIPIDELIDMSDELIVLGGKAESVRIRLKDNKNHIIVKKSDLVPKAKVELVSYAVAPVSQGQSVGQVRIILDNEVIFESEIVTDEKVDKKEKSGFFKSIFN